MLIVWPFWHRCFTSAGLFTSPSCSVCELDHRTIVLLLCLTRYCTLNILDNSWMNVPKQKSMSSTPTPTWRRWRKQLMRSSCRHLWADVVRRSAHEKPSWSVTSAFSFLFLLFLRILGALTCVVIGVFVFSCSFVLSGSACTTTKPESRNKRSHTHTPTVASKHSAPHDGKSKNDSSMGPTDGGGWRVSWTPIGSKSLTFFTGSVYQLLESKSSWFVWKWYC